MTTQHHEADRRADRGAGAVEYALLISGIAAVVVAAVLVFGGFVDGVFRDSCDDIAAEAGGPTC